MGTRSVIELIEELALRGGGFGLFTGCAAGDTAMAVGEGRSSSTGLVVRHPAEVQDRGTRRPR